MKTSLKNYEYNTYDLQNMGGIQFIKTSNGRAHCIPEGQQETDGWEGFLTTGKCFCLATLATGSGNIGFHLDSGVKLASAQRNARGLIISISITHPKVEFSLVVVQKQIATEASFAKQIEELDPGSGGNKSPELLPSAFAVVEGNF